jgi:MinD-like ATPase involved in chromosome partitioning or flagellar assembly
MRQEAGDQAWVDLAAPLWQQSHGSTPHDSPPLADTTALTRSPRPVPRRGRLLLPEDYLPQEGEPPELGWRRAAWRAGARWIKPGPRELRRREWTRLARHPVLAPRVIAVVSPKGGVGKSTTAALLGGVLARVRGDLVAALDGSHYSGDLAERLSDTRSPFGVHELHRDAHQIVRYSDLAPYLTISDTGLRAVRSDPGSDVRLGPAEYCALLAMLSRFFSITVVDLGTGIREPAFEAVIEAADAVVAVTGTGFDAVEVLVEGLDWLSRRFPAVSRTVTAVINVVAPKWDALDASRIAETLRDWAAGVIQVPRDPHLAVGGVVQWPLLTRHTQDASLELAAAVISVLPDSGPARGPTAEGREP